MARTIAQIDSELAIAYTARANLIAGKTVTESSFASAESSRKFIKATVTLADIENYINSLLLEKAGLAGETNTLVIVSGSTIPNVYRKAGI